MGRGRQTGWDQEGCPRPLSRSARSRGQHSPIRLGTNRKMFSLGIAATPWPPRAGSGAASSVSAPPRGLTLRPGAPAAPTARRPRCPRSAPDVKTRCERELGPPQLCAGRGGRAHPALPMGRPSPPPSPQALQPPAAVPPAPLVLSFREPTLLRSYFQNWRKKKRL